MSGASRKLSKEYRTLSDSLRFGGTLCTYCGARACVVDHMHPYSRGGSNELSNLTPACAPCNSEKSDSTVEEWRQLRVDNGLLWPPVRRSMGAMYAMVEFSIQEVLSGFATPTQALSKLAQYAEWGQEGSRERLLGLGFSLSQVWDEDDY